MHRMRSGQPRRTLFGRRSSCRTLRETVLTKGFRDRQATEMEITESVANRLMKWGGWLTAIAALILAGWVSCCGL